jgi:hypothetical protein
MKVPFPLTVACALVAASAAAAAPAMSTIWQETSLDLADCVRQAETAMRDAGLTRNTQTLHESVYGEQGLYTGSIRCLSGKGVVFIVVSGPRQDRAAQYVGALKSRF